MKSFVRRLHVPRTVEEKALEYCRLAEVKCSSSSRGAISPSCLAIVCIDLACVQLGEPFDKVPPSPPSLSLSSLFSTALLKPPVDYDLLSHVLKLYRRLVNVSLVCHQKSISPPTRLLKSCSMSSVVFLSKTWLFDLTASRHSLWQKPYSTSMPFSHLCTINFMNVR